MNSTNRWLATLFDEGDSTCSTERPNGTAVSPASAAAQTTHQFVCINALDATTDHEPIQEWHSPDKPRRADANVTKLRTMLVEFDSIPLEKQVETVLASGLPYSVMTYSGGKSFHFLVCLVEPCKDRHDYAQLVARVYSALGGKLAGLDESTKNPSRLTRTPNAVRDNGVMQELIEVVGRVPRADLEAWLDSKGAHKAPVKSFSIKPKLPGIPNWRSPLNTKSLYFLSFGAPKGEWNQSCFKTACDMVRSGYTEDEIVSRMEKAFKTLDPNVYMTIKSAVRRATQDKEVTGE